METLENFGISQKLFEEWREPREGTDNPTKANNPVWNWLVQTKLSAWAANKASERDYYADGPTWCFDRYGQSTTQLPDGRKIYIGGEHEDHYDPDFCIYNDVVVEHIDGSLDIYIYPQSVFPATDFHSATLVNNEIFIIGRLGYHDQRHIKQTPVFILNINNFSIRKQETTGSNPGWIFGHNATLLEDGKTLLIRQGEIYSGPETPVTENINEWCLDLSSGSWKLSKENNWPRWQYIRADKKYNLLWELRQLLWHQDMNWKSEHDRELVKLIDQLGHHPDLPTLKSLYQPPLKFEPLPEREGDGEYNQHRILVEGVVVRYKEEHWEIQVTVEGYLPPKIVALLKEDLYSKLSDLVKTQWEISDI
jgi:hypothetical protein